MSKPLVCVVCGSKNIDNFSSAYYNFPTCPVRRDKWIQLLDLDKNSLKSTSRVCQQHFSKSQIVRIKLIKNAMPKNVRKQDASQKFQNPNISTGIVGWVVNGNVNVGMGTNARLLQAKPNVSVDDEDEGLEKAVICNNKSIRRGQQPCEELCLICAQLPDPLETNEPPLASDQLSSVLNPHLWSMFVLKLLNFPKEEYENVFTKTFGINPGEWFRLCGPCFQIVEQAFTLEQEVAKLQKKLERVKSNSRKKLEESLKLDKCSTAKKKSKAVFDISLYIRHVFKDISNKQVEQSTPTIKAENDEIRECNSGVTNISVKVIEMNTSSNAFDTSDGDDDDNIDVEIKVFDESPKPLNETTTNKCNDTSSKQQAESTPTIIKEDESSEIEIKDYDNCSKPSFETDNSKSNRNGNNTTLKMEHAKAKNSILYTCDGNNTDNQEILSNNLSTKYSHNNAKRKIAKKLTLTAIKRCRIPESQDQKPPNISRNTNNIPRTDRTLPTRLTCSLCPAKFVLRRNVILHLRSHKKYKETSCPKCNFPCKTPEKLKRHLTLNRCTFQGQGSSLSALSLASHHHHEKCHICGRIYPSKIQLAKHLRNHQSYKSTTCPVCQLPCGGQQKLANHMKICNANSGQAEEFKCGLCGYTTDYPYVFSKHKRTHELAKFSCEVCSFPSLSQAWLKTHMREMHGVGVTERRVRGPGRITLEGKLNGCDKSQDMISCHLCPALFPNHFKVNRHVRTVHETSYPCSKCESIFEYQSHLRNHLLEKHGIETEKFICDTCGMQFTSYSGVYKHKKMFHLSSTNDKPASDVATVEGGNMVSKYERKCPHCEVCCCNMKALKIHLRANHPELYKHKCKLCPLTYISSGNLKIHMKNVHLKEEVECVKCKAKMRGSSMRGHLKLFCRFRPQTDDTNSSKISD